MDTAYCVRCEQIREMQFVFAPRNMYGKSLSLIGVKCKTCGSTGLADYGFCHTLNQLAIKKAKEEAGIK